MKKLMAVVGLLACMMLSACDNAANVASRNLSAAADNFEINRHIVFYNGFTGDFLLEITGYCSKGNDDSSSKMTITCKVGPNEFKKHYLGLSDNVTYMIEQLDPAPVNTYNYRVNFKPSVLIPSIHMD